MAADARITAPRKEKTHTHIEIARKEKEEILPSSLGSFVKSRFFFFLTLIAFQRGKRLAVKSHNTLLTVPLPWSTQLDLARRLRFWYRVCIPLLQIYMCLYITVRLKNMYQLNSDVRHFWNQFLTLNSLTVVSKRCHSNNNSTNNGNDNPDVLWLL